MPCELQKFTPHLFETTIYFVTEIRNMKNTRRPGGGRKPAKPEYSKEKNLKEQLNAAVELYKKGMSLKAIGDELLLNPIKVRKLLITAEVYKSEIAEKVKSTFDECETKESADGQQSYYCPGQ